MVIKRYPTKIMLPNYARVFERAHLFELVKGRKIAKVIWVNGSLGAGKTVFVANLLKKQHTSFLWYRIDSNENDLADIFYFLTLAVQKNYPRRKLYLPVFTAEYADDIENFARVFFHELFASLTKESAIVLDNCHELEKNSVFFRLIQIAINQLPEGMQLICISRNRLNAALKRLYFNNELFEISNAELEFNNQEGQAFLKWLEPQLNDLQIQQIQSKTHGWAARMVLMARQFSILGFTEDANGEENIFDYLASEILFHLPAEQRKFLVVSALFTQLTAEMGMQLTDCKQAKSYLNEFVSKNFLIKRIEKSNPIYQFHPLFRDFLLTQADTLFTQAYWRKLQRKAAMILVKQDSILEAMFLFRQLEDWSSLKELLLEQANQLINTGRHHTVSQWMEVLPSKYLDTDAWLNYWYGIALKPADPLLAERWLEKSYQQFVINHDIKGIYSAWQAAVESIAISWDDFSRLKVWINRFNEIRKHYPVCPSIELKIQFYATAIHGLSVYNPQHPWLRSLIRICEGIFRFIPIKSVKMLLGTQLGHYYSLTSQINKLRSIAPILVSALEDEKLPSLSRIISSFLLVIQKLYDADASKALEYSNKGLELTNKTGIDLFKNIFLINIVGCHFINNDLANSENALQQAIVCCKSRERATTAMIYSYAAWHATLADNFHYALRQNQQALQLSKLLSLEIGYVCSLSLRIQILAELSEWQRAERTLSLLRTLVTDAHNQFNMIQYYMSDAWLAYLQQNVSRALTAVERFLKILSAEQIFFYFNWRPKVLAPLCLLAIENSIEEEFAMRLLKRHRLFPSPPPLHLEQWPWPVRIYSFVHW